MSLQELLALGPVALLIGHRSCPTCQWAFPYLDRLFARHPDLPEGRVFFVLQEDSETAGRIRDQYQLTTPILLDPEPYRASESFGFGYVPDGMLIEESGIIRSSFESFDRGKVEEFGAFLEEQFRLKPTRLFDPEEGVPAFRPG